MHIIYRKYLNDSAPPKVQGVITSNKKAIKYVEAKNKEEQRDGGWWEWSSQETKAIIV